MLGRWRRYSAMSAATQERMRRLTAVAVNLAGVSQQLISVGLLIGGFYRFNEGDMTMGAIIAIIMLAGRALSADRPARVPVHPRQPGDGDARFAAADDGGRPTSARSRCAASCRRSAPATSSSRMLGFRYPKRARRLACRHQPQDQAGRADRRSSAASPRASRRSGRVLCGLYAPTEGEMLVDGLDSRQYHPHQLREAFRFVGQDAELFSGTVRDNLMLGAAQADDKQLIDAVVRSGADIFLSRDAAGFDLSGRRARLAAVGRPALAAGPGPGAGVAVASCCSSTSRPARWTPRPSSISSSI